MYEDKNKSNLAKKYFEMNRYEDAFVLFDEIGAHYEKGLCKLLVKDTRSARRIWENYENPCLATYWGLTVLDLIKLKYKDFPTYFQVRAFLEVYLNLFIENNHLAWAENLISAWELFSNINYESCKFIARVLFYHNYLDLTLEFAEKSRKFCAPDPEALFIEAQCFEKMHEYHNAEKCLEEIIRIVPNYIPALEMQKKIVTRLNN